MKLGLDYWNTISRSPEHFATLASSVISEKGEVHIISAIGKGRSAVETRQAIEKTGVPYTTVSVLVWQNGHKEAPLLKLAECQKLGIDMFVDDRLDTCELLMQHGIIALCYLKPRRR